MHILNLLVVIKELKKEALTANGVNVSAFYIRISVAKSGAYCYGGFRFEILYNRSERGQHYCGCKDYNSNYYNLNQNRLCIRALAFFVSALAVCRCAYGGGSLNAAFCFT